MLQCVTVDPWTSEMNLKTSISPAEQGSKHFHVVLQNKNKLKNNFANKLQHGRTRSDNVFGVMESHACELYVDNYLRPG